MCIDNDYNEAANENHIFYILRTKKKICSFFIEERGGVGLSIGRFETRNHQGGQGRPHASAERAAEVGSSLMVALGIGKPV